MAQINPRLLNTAPPAKFPRTHPLFPSLSLSFSRATHVQFIVDKHNLYNPDETRALELIQGPVIATCDLLQLVGPLPAFPGIVPDAAELTFPESERAIE
jgi:hypothetical protein